MNEPNKKQDGKKDSLRPEQNNQEITKPKKRHGLRNFFITLGIIVVVIIVAVGATGVYEIPGVSSIFGMNKPKDLGIKTGPEYLETLKEKIPMSITGATTDYASGGEIFSGEITVDTQTSSEEVTSWLQRFEGDNPVFSDVQVKQIEGGMEISAMLNEYIKAPVYVMVMVDQVGENKIALDLKKAKVGAFGVPENYIGQIEDFFEDRINSLMSSVPGFKMESFEIHEEISSFKGTYPASVKPSSRGWNDLLYY